MTAADHASPSHGRSSRRLLGRDGRKIVIGVLLIILVVFGPKLYGMATANNRLDPSLRHAAEPKNVIVVLDFMPERFHNERIAAYGTFAGRDGALNRYRLRGVSPENLQTLAEIPWVARIEPMR
jgi:hypothetical protein